MRLQLPILVVAALAIGIASAEAELLTSFENTLDGWTTSVDQPTYAFDGFSTTQGVTHGNYAAIVTGTANPSYGPLLIGPSSVALTESLSQSESLSIDVEIETSGDFGFFLQWTAAINNADLGYTSLDDFTYTQALGAGAATLVWDITESQRAILAASSADSQIVFQVGGGGGGTFFADNVRIGLIPEPASLLMLCLTAVATLTQRIR